MTLLNDLIVFFSVTFFFFHMPLYEQVKRTFDEALKSGAVETLEMQTEYMDTSVGVPLPLRLPGKRNRKGTSTIATPTAKESPFLHPEPALVVSSDLFPHHNVLLNKFPAVRDHLLLCTKEYEPQRGALSENDVSALSFLVRNAYEPVERALGFYNGGLVSGASQGHKHAQVVPLGAICAPGIGEEAKETSCPCVLDRVIQNSNEKERTSGVIDMIPYKHSFEMLNISRDSVKEEQKAFEMLYEAYKRCLDKCGVDPDDDKTSHNVLVTTEWIIVIPRSAESYEMDGKHASLNAMAFAGSLLVKSKETIESIKQHPEKIVSILSQITYPK